MTEGKTLWRRFVDYWKEPTLEEKEQSFYNPLKSNFGTDRYSYSVSIDTLEYRNRSFAIQNMREYTLNYKGRSFKATDYFLRTVLQDSPLDENLFRLKVFPHDSPGRDLQILTLSQIDEIPYDEEFKRLLDDQQFNITDDEGGSPEQSFWRINEVKTPYQARTREKDKEGSVEEGEVWYWDYWRETNDEGGSSKIEFLFIEWDKGDTGVFTLWRGEEVPQACIFV